MGKLIDLQAGFENAMFILNAASIEFEAVIEDGRWRSRMDDIEDDLIDALVGDFVVLFAREDEATDVRAFYSVCFADPQDENRILRYAADRQYGITRRSSANPRVDPGPVPEWLRDFSLKSPDH